MQPFILWQKIEPPYIFGILSNFKKVQIGYLDSYGNKVYYASYYDYEDIADDYEPEQEPKSGEQFTGAEWNRKQQRKYYKNLRENLNNSNNPEYTRPQHLADDIQFTPLQQHSSSTTKWVASKISQFENTVRENIQRIREGVNQQTKSKEILKGVIDKLSFHQEEELQEARNSYNILGQFTSSLGLVADNPSYGMSYNDNDEFKSQSSNGDIAKVKTYKAKLNDNLTEISKKFSVSIIDLKKWNNIKNENSIDVGQLIIVSDPNKSIKYEKFISYPSYGASTGWNTRNLNHSKDFETTTASSGYEVGRASLGGYDVCNFSGSLLDAVKVDPELVKLQNEIISKAKNDPNYGKYIFYFSNQKVIGFGGQRWRSLEESWSSVSRKNPLLHKSTWMVAANTLTWVLRNATVKYFVEVDAKGEIKIQYRVHDGLDLSPQEGRSNDYNKISEALGFGYHTLLGGNKNMQTRATWTVIEKK